MDENNRRRRQNDPPYAAPEPRFSGDQTQGRGFPSSSAERYRPAPITTSTSMARTGSATTAYSTYYPESTNSFPAGLTQNNIQFQADGYPQDQRQQQGFSAYNSEIMYNVAPQSQQGHVYGSSAQFQTRQPAVMHILSDVAAPYFPNESNSSTGPPGLQHHTSSTSSAVYQQHQESASGRSSLIPQPYPTSLAMGGLAQSAPELIGEDDFQAEGPGMEVAYTSYQTALKEIFGNIINGRLLEASQSLLEVSEWLLGHVGDLGLTVDEVTLHADRIRLWGEFNTAWLSIFQKQKDVLESSRPLQPTQSLMSQEFIKKMARDLIRMCDAIEKHGLVDYQYGVAEEQIMMILTECLDIQESMEGVGAGHGPGRAAV